MSRGEIKSNSLREISHIRKQQIAADKRHARLVRSKYPTDEIPALNPLPEPQISENLNIEVNSRGKVIITAETEGPSRYER